jgi:hypothetical protein
VARILIDGVGSSAQAGEFGAGLVGVRMIEVVEDGQGLSPGIAGGVEVAGGVLGVAEVSSWCTASSCGT